MISPDILIGEILTNKDWRELQGLPPLKVYVDERAHMVTSHHIAQEQETGLAERIGSTSTVAREGIGAAQAARVLRTDYALAINDPRFHPIIFCDTVKYLHEARIMGVNILLEGTQGTGLSNTTGIYPYVTSRCVTASGLAADCGFGPLDIDHVIIVARTFPIRVAGNSGPFWEGSTELTWEQIGVDENSERTTVTKKIRRVASFSYEQIQHAVHVNSATEVALTFADYLAPELRDKSGSIGSAEFAGFDRVGDMVDEIEALTAVPVTFVGTGPETVLDRASELDPVQPV